MSEETSQINPIKVSLNQRNFQPQFQDKLVGLPKIEQFSLEDLINVQLRQESQQVVDSLLNVTTNYQNDLRLEIKRKLSTEQKIQFKNIEIAKLTSSINKFIHNKRKKLYKTLQDSSSDAINLDLDELLNITINSSDKCKSITEKLARIDQLVNNSNHTLQNPNSFNRNKYPNLHKLFHPQDDLPQIQQITNDAITEKAKKSSQELLTSIDSDILTTTTNGTNAYSNGIVNDNDVTTSMKRNGKRKSSQAAGDNVENDKDNDNDNDKNNTGNNDIPNIDNFYSRTNQVNGDMKLKRIENVNSEGGNSEDCKSKKREIVKDLSLSLLSSPKLNNTLPSELQLSPDDFETNLVKKDTETQALPSKPIKANNTNVAEPDIPMNADEFEIYMSESIYKYREARERRYSKLDSFDETGRKRISHKFSLNNPINLLYSSLLSNPKYIDSSPINEINPFSSMLSIKSSATIKSSLQISHHKKLRINGAPITSASYLNPSTKRICACSNDDNEQNHDTAESLAKKSLTENLDHLAIGSDDELWNSSGLTTETEEDEETALTKIPSSHSSDSDSSDSNVNNESIANINSIYSALKLEKKIKILKKDKRSRSKKQRKRFSVRPDELSPSPKHKPSHHILKPKRSILKSNSNLKWKPTVSTEIDINEVSALADVNTAFDRTTRSSITDYTVCGTILGFPADDSDFVQEDNEVEAWYGDRDEDDNNSTSDIPSIKSITRLKDLLDL